MTVDAVAQTHTSAVNRAKSGEPTPLWRLVDRYSPSQGWDVFLLMTLAVYLVALTVRQGDWVETPGILTTAVAACVVGLILAKVKAPWPLLFPAGLAVGVLVVVWQGSNLIEGQPLTGRFSELWDRLSAWYEAATTGGISTDLLPFTLTLVAMAWLLGYVSSWFLFRQNNIWVGLLISGTALLTVQSFLPDTLRAEFFVFMLLAMLLVSRQSTLQRRARWSRDGILHSTDGNWLGTRLVAALSIPVLLVAAAVPLQMVVSRTAVDVWNLGRTPIAGFEDEFSRLFSGIPSRTDLKGRFFGTTLPFQGKISFEGEVVFWATSEQPSYWLSRTYNEYTSRGWKAGDVKRQRAGPDSLPPPPQESSKRELVTQHLELSFGTGNLLAGGNLAWVSREAVVETLAPLEFEIDMVDPSGDDQLPKDVQTLAQRLRRALSTPSTGFVESSISKMLPQDLALVSVSPDGGNQGASPVAKVRLARKEPSVPDVVSWKFADRLREDESYTMRSFVSDASESELKAAGTDYSGFIKDHYLQLPASLPERVKALAAGLTQDAETPLRKTLVIQQFLRGPSFTYSQDIEKPPSDGDGVDHFLFETRVGYSDYYASAMAVMLRSVGVPARMAAGYAPGVVEDGTGRRAVRDSDSHGWTQVYFPGHGWIDFEPTTRWPLPQRGSAADELPELDPNRLPPVSPECLDPTTVEPALLDECLDEIPGKSDLSDLGALRDDSPFDPSVLIAPLATAAAILSVLTIAVWLLWTRGLANATLPESLYTKMSRLGTLAGIGRRHNQTPSEYATALGIAVPAIAANAQQVAWAYTADRYSRQEQPAQGLQELNELWKRVRGGLLVGIMRRLVPL